MHKIFLIAILVLFIANTWVTAIEVNVEVPGRAVRLTEEVIAWQGRIGTQSVCHQIAGYRSCQISLSVAFADCVEEGVLQVFRRPAGEDFDWDGVGEPSSDIMKAAYCPGGSDWTTFDLTTWMIQVCDDNLAEFDIFIGAILPDSYGNLSADLITGVSLKLLLFSPTTDSEQD